MTLAMSTTKNDLFPEISKTGEELVLAFRAHEQAKSEFYTTIWAIHGVQSFPGRIIDRLINPSTPIRLYDDFFFLGLKRPSTVFWQYDCCKPKSRFFVEEDEPEPRKINPSQAARRMLANELCRSRGPRLVSNPQTNTALLVYANERVELWRRAEDLFSSGAKRLGDHGYNTRQETVKHYAKEAARERKQFEKLRDWLDSNMTTNK